MNARPIALLFAHVLFWGWNLLFVNLLVFGYTPVLLLDMLVAASVGVVPWGIALPASCRSRSWRSGCCGCARTPVGCSRCFMAYKHL